MSELASLPPEGPKRSRSTLAPDSVLSPQTPRPRAGHGRPPTRNSVDDSATPLVTAGPRSSGTQVVEMDSTVSVQRMRRAGEWRVLLLGVQPALGGPPPALAAAPGGGGDDDSDSDSDDDDDDDLGETV